MKPLASTLVTILEAPRGQPSAVDIAFLHPFIAAINDCSMITVLDRDGAILYANEKFCAHTGFERHELIGTRHSAIDVEKLQFNERLGTWKQREGRCAWRGEVESRAQSGAELWTDTTVTPILYGAGEPNGFLCLHHDISSKKEVEHTLMKSRQHEEQMLRMSTEWLWEMDREFRFTMVSDGIRRMGHDPRRFLGKQRWDISGDGNEQKWQEHRSTLAAHKPFKGFEYCIRDEDAPTKLRWFCVSGEPCFDESGQFTGYKGLGWDTTSQRAQQEAMWQLANVDSLTGLPNRMRFHETLKQTIEAESGLITALILINLDDFKSVNDRNGTKAGDYLLVAMTQHLKDALIPPDFVARIASDEFAIVRYGVEDANELTDILDILVHSLQMRQNSAELAKQSISIGASLHPIDAKSPEELLKNAQLALHVAKRNGGNQYVVFSSENCEIATRQSELVEQMHQALDRGELALHYQPIVDPTRRIVVGLEALLRWQTQSGELLAPGAFWGAFSNMALASRIGKFVMQAAIAQAGEWKRLQIPFGKVAFNVTSADFAAGGFTKSLERLLFKHGLDPFEICIEVTEGMFLGASANRVTLELLGLSEMGVEIAFDDFGTGYASLMHLKLPIDRLKIDRSFVDNIEFDATNSAIVQAVAKLGQSLGKFITVEGVETASQSNILKEMGCCQQQGYLFSKPLPADDVSNFIKSFSGVAVDAQ